MGEAPQQFHDFGSLGQGIHAHGTRANYQAGCRCPLCRSANARYEAWRTRAKTLGRTAWVSAEAARAKLARLARVGIGHRQAAKLAGVSFRTVQRIRTGQAQRIRPSIANAILAIERPSLAKGVCVNGYETRHYVESLMREGYTRPGLAEKLGLRGRLRIGAQVTAETALRLRALYQRLTAE